MTATERAAIIDGHRNGIAVHFPRRHVSPAIRAHVREKIARVRYHEAILKNQ